MIAWLAWLAGCGVEREVLRNPTEVVTTCADAWRVGVNGGSCAFEGTCSRPSPLAPDCCTDYAYCAGSSLVLSDSCSEGCGCISDDDCVSGASICAEGACVACPGEALCAPCPEGWERLSRNGCATCQCAPPSECGPTAECEVGTCYPGASCADGCDAEHEGCCANVCAEEGCASPAPLGCVTACTDGSEGWCATSFCACAAGAWVCEAIAIDELDVSCSFP